MNKSFCGSEEKTVGGHDMKKGHQLLTTPPICSVGMSLGTRLKFNTDLIRSINRN